MKTKLFIAISLVSLACGSALLTSCSDRVYFEGNRGRYVTNYGTGILDAMGFPIFGYQHGRPVYGYDTVGLPVFQPTLIRRDYYVPAWEPSTEYKGNYYYPKGVKRIGHLPHQERGWAKPVLDGDKPSIVDPTPSAKKKYYYQSYR